MTSSRNFRKIPQQLGKMMVIAIATMFMCVFSYAQTLTPKQDSKGKWWGYVDENGKTVIKHKFRIAREFAEDLAAVYFYDKKSGRYIWGFIDKTGTILISCPNYYEVNDFSCGLARVDVGGYSRYHFIDKTGNVVAKFAYKDADNFFEGLARVNKNDGYRDRWGFIDKTGKEITLMKYYKVTNFSNGYAGVSDGKWGIIDKTGKEILPTKYEENEVSKMLSDPALVKNEVQRIADVTQKEIQQKQEEEAAKQRKLQEESDYKTMLIEEVESVLDNDYYSDNCHPVKVLEELQGKLDKLEKSLPMNISNMSEKTYLSELKGALRDAISAQTLTKKYGAATAKKIVAGKYEIGMSKEMVEEALRHQKIPILSFYKKSVSASTENMEY